MKRQALIIGNPGKPGAENYCKGVERDLVNYPAFLESALGGTWHDSEIITLKRPTLEVARAGIRLLAAAEYSFAVFCGHGCTDGRTGALMLELKEGHELHEHELRTGAERHTVIYDCCRRIARPVLTEDRMMKAVLARADASPRDSRAYFDRAVGECARGQVAMYACSIGEAAGDDERAGGYYSSSLIVGAKSWSESGDFDTQKSAYRYSVVKAHNSAEETVKARTSNEQNPHINKPRSDPYFPFAIVA